MSALRNLVDKLKPTFTKGGKLGFLESTFDAFETFLFVPDTTTSKGAHIRDCNDMKRSDDHGGSRPDAGASVRFL